MIMNFDFLSPILGVLSQIHIRFVTALRGHFVGQDAFGNCYYQNKHNAKKRWVIYAHRADASEVMPEWHGWLHHQTDVVPTSDANARYRRPWQQPYVPNMTGTNAAYVPPGHPATATPRAAATGDYEAWRPGT